jgi:hypothetical protein
MLSEPELLLLDLELLNDVWSVLQTWIGHVATFHFLHNDSSVLRRPVEIATRSGRLVLTACLGTINLTTRVALDDPKLLHLLLKP